MSDQTTTPAPAFQLVERKSRQAVPSALPDPVDFAKDHEYGTRVALADGTIYALRKPTWQIVPPAKSNGAPVAAGASAPDAQDKPAGKR